MDVDVFKPTPVRRDAPFTTVMNWQSYEPVHYRGVDYGHKDVEFGKFIRLPGETEVTLELAHIARARLVPNYEKLFDSRT